MIRHTMVLSLVCGFCVSVARAEDGPTFEHVIPTDSVQFVKVFSTDSQTGAMLFDNLLIDTEIGRATVPSVGTKKFVYVLQPKHDKEVSVTQMIRGFVSTQGSGSAALIVHAGGITTTVDLSKAIEAAKNGGKRVNEELWKQAQTLAKEQGFTDDPRPDKSDDFLVEIKSHVPAGQPLQTTILLLVDRLPGEDGSGALLVIDSIDFVVSAVHPAKR